MQLIHRAQAGDRQAFAALFEQYKNLVYKTAYLMLDDSGEAEDALQEVFILVHRSLSTFDSRKGAFTTWLYRITTNYCLNHRRKRNHSVLPLDDAMSANDFPVAQMAERDSVWQAIKKLSDKQRAVIILRYFSELSYADIANILDIPLGTVKSRLDMALKSLRKILDEQESDKGSVSRAEVCE